MTDAHAIAEMPRPRIKRVSITDPVTFLANQLERTLRDTSLSKDRRIEEAIAICRAAKSEKHNG